MYLSAAAIAAMPGERRVHFLNPQAIRLNKSLGDAAGMGHLGVHLITVEPGDRSTEFHAHHYEEECIYVLSGSATAVIGEERHRIRAGDFIGCPCNGVPHEIVNDGAEPLVCLVVGERLTQDITDYPRRGKRLFRHSGRRDLMDHAQIRPA
jgi:uncharacterized cupin superfamily protein